MNEKLTFVYCFDENYSKQGLSSIISLLDTSSEEINILIIYNLVPSKIKIPNIIKDHKNLNKIEIKQFLNSDYNFPNLEENHVSSATYYRLFVDDYIDNTVSTIFYIDADIIFIKNPINLFKKAYEHLLDSEFVISARTEKSLRQKPDEVFKRLNLSEKYFNAGVLVINLELWRKQNIQEKLIKNMKKISNLIVHWDQDVMNSYFDGEYQELDNNLNFESSSFNEKSEDVVALHFLGSNKPWYMSGVFRYGSHFYHENFNKFNNSKYHIVHLWKRASIIEFIKSIFNLNFFKIKFPLLFIKSFIESLR